MHTAGDVDCVGSWSSCTADCSDKTYSVTRAQAGLGSACEAADGATATCHYGQGSCSAATAGDVDCVGSWSSCTADCSDKTYSVTRTQTGAGSACEAADGATATCNYGEGSCADACANNACSQNGDQSAACSASSGGAYTCACSLGWEALVDRTRAVMCIGAFRYACDEHCWTLSARKHSNLHLACPQKRLRRFTKALH